jgi:hypothetical protein
MQDTKSKPPEHFFFRHKWLLIVYGIVVVSSALLAPMNLRFGDALHRMQAGVQLGMAVTFGWLSWYWWRTWKHPLVTVSDEGIEWGEGSPRHREHVRMHDVLELCPPVGPSATPVGLRTRSRGTVWINVAGLSPADRGKVCSAITARLPPPPDHS